ncbi:hypothetical protein D1Y84_14735 [Acidipila sp. EB88]|nr:hypothetical protein D1Y84_14735 [Acidipila sp. EB88]
MLRINYYDVEAFKPPFRFMEQYVYDQVISGFYPELRVRIHNCSRMRILSCRGVKNDEKAFWVWLYPSNGSFTDVGILPTNAGLKHHFYPVILDFRKQARAKPLLLLNGRS